MTNLIDIVMMLLIVFILVSNFVQTGLNIELPEVQYVQATGKEKIIIGVSASGDLTLNGQPVPEPELSVKLAELKTQYPDEAVFVQADRMAIVENLMNAISVAKEVGFTQVNIPAIRKTES